MERVARSLVTGARCALALVLLCFGVQAAQADDTARRVFAASKASVVVLDTVDLLGEPLAQGSGVVIAPTLIATNWHVVKGAAQVNVRAGSSTTQATVASADPQRDIAILFAPGATAAPPIAMSNQAVSVGDSVFTLGAPQGLDLTLASGIVSSVRHIDTSAMIQTTAPISPGSSGGALLDVQGRLIGITTSHVRDGQALNFAVPVRVVSEVRSNPAFAVSAAAQSVPLLNDRLAFIRLRSDGFNVTMLDLRSLKASDGLVAARILSRGWDEKQIDWIPCLEFDMNYVYDCADGTVRMGDIAVNEFCGKHETMKTVEATYAVDKQPHPEAELVCQWTSDRAQFFQRVNEAHQQNAKHIHLHLFDMVELLEPTSVDADGQVTSARPTHFAASMQRVNPRFQSFK